MWPIAFFGHLFDSPGSLALLSDRPLTLIEFGFRAESCRDSVAVTFLQIEKRVCADPFSLKHNRVRTPTLYCLSDLLLVNKLLCIYLTFKTVELVSWPALVPPTWMQLCFSCYDVVTVVVAAALQSLFGWRQREVPVWVDWTETRLPFNVFKSFCAQLPVTPSERCVKPLCHAVLFISYRAAFVL